MKKPYLVILVDGQYDYDDRNSEKCVVPEEWTDRLVVDLEDEEAEALNRPFQRNGVLWRAYEVIPPTTVRERLSIAIEDAKAYKKRQEENEATVAARLKILKADEEQRKLAEAKRTIAVIEAALLSRRLAESDGDGK